ncbi:hypothetical protein B0T18DRAFT_412168 [Schizothecium vesticola]|uniref:Uncharacterized protein n=1 Tax=Schizothecium vesticola TaxID=314040 RepID=A0AA40EW48_9PEZI|nr:hypothetical protein B0T18DRAFT_412168 [Schizothecium vesticola]
MALPGSRGRSGWHAHFFIPIPLFISELLILSLSQDGERISPWSYGRRQFSPGLFLWAFCGLDDWMPCHILHCRPKPKPPGLGEFSCRRAAGYEFS